MKLLFCPLLAAALAAPLVLAQAPKRPLSLDDMARIRAVGDPQCSPDGQWVAYTVGHVDVKGDKHVTHIWMASLDGKQNLQMTDGQQSESAPRWSPDGKYLSFTSSRPGAAHGNQVWLLNRAGGEATQLTNVKGSLHSYAWSPDSKQLGLVIEDPDPNAPAPDASHNGPPPPPKPIIIDRYKFKEDRIGYLTDRETHVYLFDIASKKLTRLTTGHDDENNPVWSPDGSRIAFFSKHDPHPDRKLDGRIWVIDVRPGAVERAITADTDYAEDSRAAWSPDGKQIAFLEGAANQWGAYTMQRLAVVEADGSDPAAVIVPSWDRGVSNPTFTADGKSVVVLTADDRNQYPLLVDMAQHTTQRLLDEPMAVNAYSVHGSCDVGLIGYNDRAPEVYREQPNGKPIELSHQNDALFQQLDLAKVEDISFPSSDGTDVHGLLYLPVGYRAGARVPFLLRIHGGPDGQHTHSFNFESQFFAAHGYAVLNVNYRG
ncbi:MAG: S9 family peptidase, partial [Terriglobales bacterium]